MATIYDSEDYFDESEGFSDESEFEEPPMPHVTTPKMVPMNSKVRPCLFCSEQRHDPSKWWKLLEVTDRERSRTGEFTGKGGTPTGQPKTAGPSEEQPTCAESGGDSSRLLTALGELTNTLNQVVKRLEKAESRIQSVEEKICTSISSSSSESSRKKSRTVPVVVKVRMGWIILILGTHSLCVYYVVGDKEDVPNPSWRRRWLWGIYCRRRVSTCSLVPTPMLGMLITDY